MIKHSKLVITLLLMGLLLTACGTKQKAVEPTRSVEESENVEESESTGNEESNENNIWNTEADNMQKSIQLVDSMYNKENIMLSPLSLNLALGLLSEGAIPDSQSDRALKQYLGEGYSDFAEDYMQNRIHNFNSDEEFSGYKTAFEIANSVWIDDLYTIKDDYKSKVESKYDAEVGSIDKEDLTGSAEKINNWCSDKTHELIPSIVDEDTIRDLTAMLVNSVYMESAWSDEWYEANEYKFTNLDGSESNAQMIANGCETYYENDKATAFQMGYINGMSFIGILPKEEGEFNIQDLDIPGLLKTETNDYDVVMSMPELNFETILPLTGVLSNTELAPIFDNNTTDFSNTICDSDLYVSAVIQKTKLELDRYGTKAAAVTAVMLETCGMAPIEEERELKEVNLDRPFAFVIYDQNSDVPVFIGKVVNADK